MWPVVFPGYTWQQSIQLQTFIRVKVHEGNMDCSVLSFKAEAFKAGIFSLPSVVRRGKQQGKKRRILVWCTW